jgi:biopolymer transport protein ExbD
MKKKKDRVSAERCQLQMTPMIDVVFQLLIFFIVTLKQEDIMSHLDVVRPAAESVKEQNPDENLLQVTVYDKGFVLQGRPINVKELDKQFTKIATYSKTASVIIKCTKDSPHGLLVQLLDVCAKNKMKNLSLFSM